MLGSRFLWDFGLIDFDFEHCELRLYRRGVTDKVRNDVVVVVVVVVEGEE